MRKLLRYMQQLSHRRLDAFEFIDHEPGPDARTPTQLVLDYGHQHEHVDGQALRRRISDAEFDDD